MYLRFVSPLRVSTRGVHQGIFHTAGACLEEEAMPSYLRVAIRSELDWFNEHLPFPGRHSFVWRSRNWQKRDGICWFKSQASEMIAHAFILRALLAEFGMFIKPIGTGKPGRVLYQDDFQIVAKPERYTPTFWG